MDLITLCSGQQTLYLKLKKLTENALEFDVRGMYYKRVTIVIYDCNVIYTVACTINMIMMTL